MPLCPSTTGPRSLPLLIAIAIAVPVGAARTSAEPVGLQDWFRAPVEVPAAASSGLAYNYGHQAGDVDGDGDVDTVFVSNGLLQANLNDGHGRLAAGYITSVAGAVSDFDNRGVLADVDGDGDRDFVCRAIGGGLAVFLWNSTTSRFDAPLVQFVTPSNAPKPLLLRAVDVDGDLDDELAILSYGGGPPSRVAFWDWDGTQLVAGPGASFAYQWNGWGNGLFVAEMTGDGVPDLGLVTGSSSGQKTIKVFRTAAGAPLPAVDNPVFTESKLLVYPADREGDGDTDLLLASESVTGQLSELAWYHNVGEPTFVEEAPTSLGTLGTLELAVGDWDGDGDADVAREGFMLENLGDGSFAAPVPLPVATESVAMVDLTGDGRLDLLAVGRMFGGDETFAFGSDGVLGDVRTAVDMDLDGDLDLRGPAQFGGAEGLLRSDAAASFTAVDLQLPSLPTGQFYSGSTPPADFDGDGRTDLLREVLEQEGIFAPVVFQRTVLLTEAGDDVWVEVASSASAAPLEIASIVEPSVFDVDVDGDLDVVSFDGFAAPSQQLRWRANDGLGHFGPPQVIGTEMIRDLGDVDGDGDVDLMVGSSLGAVIPTHLLRNLGGGSFASEPLIDAWHGNLADVDGDGDLDAIGKDISSSPQQVLVRENVGGVFGPTYVAGNLGGLCNPSFFEAGDVTGDGTFDLVGTTVDPNSGNVPVLRGVPGSSPRTFVPSRCFLTPFVAQIADFDSDGDLDLAGDELFLGRAVGGPGAPRVQQYGTGAVGQGGWTPLLGSSGVPRVGETVETRLVNGPGGALTFYFYGSAEAFLPDFPAPGLNVYIAGLFPPFTFVLDGAGGAAGQGGFSFPYPVQPGFAGIELFKQALVVDASGPGGLTLSNALRVRYGG